jgi:hypothetical protein
VANAIPATSPQVGPTVPCDANVGACVQGFAPALIGAGANVRALLGCDTQANAARLSPRIQCVGTKPTAAQLATQLGR